MQLLFEDDKTVFLISHIIYIQIGFSIEIEFLFKLFSGLINSRIYAYFKCRKYGSIEVFLNINSNSQVLVECYNNEWETNNG